MTFIQLIACIGLIAGAFILLGLSPIEFTDGLFVFLTKRPKSIRDEINEVAKRKRPSFLRREITEAQDILALTGRSNRFLLYAHARCCCLLLVRASPS